MSLQENGDGEQMDREQMDRYNIYCSVMLKFNDCLL